MEKIPYPQDVDLSQFGSNFDPKLTKYGLPSKVEFCKKCVISNQRPNSTVEYTHTKESKKATIFFDENGICDACNYAEKKKSEIDWKQREVQLKELCDKYRKNDGSYDCIVPGAQITYSAFHRAPFSPFPKFYVRSKITRPKNGVAP